MKKVESGELSGLQEMFIVAAKGQDYGLNDFKTCYCRYFGCGNHLYILVNECDSETAEKIVEIGNQRPQRHPSLMAKQLSAFVNDFRVVMIDVEIGGMGVWK